ncbi:HemK2/MTQ2 family protein methyltransferase [Ferroplasma sp.]|uniref:HemK2/MTQ2 family protein methyltransferase n=1 Tax=Ferroplasma sp. TaxID=2591003 RepID=UPI0026390950|nr:HemK2/MTQ2 family protein methyltransferase [Ferroplasma sp.]
MINIDYSETVYRPAEDTYLLMDHTKCGQKVLEMGAGTGIISINLALQGHTVTAVDISQDAVELIKHNAGINKVSIEVIESDLFQNIHGKYDTLIFNPPYLPVENESPQWAGGSDGFAVTGRFLASADKYLNRCGNIYIILSDLTDIESFIRKNKNYVFTEIASESFDFESIKLYELKVRK